MPIRIATPLALVACLAGAFACAADAEPPKLSLDVIGLRVSRPHALNERVLWPAGTTLSLLVSSPIGELIRFDATDSTVAKFVDDKGTDLQARPKDATAEQIALAGFGNAAKIDKDAKNCIVEVSAPSLPAKGASRIQILGTLTMLCATQKKETVVANVPIKNGTKIAGPNNLELEIAEMNEAPRDLGRDAMVFVLRAQHELDGIAEIKFFRPDGGEVKAARTSTSTLTIQGNVKVDWSYTFSERVDTSTVKLYTWSDIQKKRIKVDLSVDLGL